jgi:protein-L-isoaspartate(D-aspartate) O-methyltransferase
MSIERARFNMVEQQIRTWDVLDATVLDVCARVNRENYVPQNLQSLAFADTEIEIGFGQHMMSPKIEARALQALKIESADRVLEVGTGSGFMAALLSSLAHKVDSLEINAELATSAAEKLASDGFKNCTVRACDGIDGFIDNAPYDAIMISGSCAERRPTLEELLAIGGRLFVVLGISPVMQAILVTRYDKETWISKDLFETTITPLIGAEKKREFQF